MFIYVSVYICFCLSKCVCVSLYVSILVCLCVCYGSVCMCLCVSLSVCLCVCLCICLYFCSCVYVCLPVCVFVYVLCVIDDPSCLCHLKTETSEHYVLDCFLYSAECQNLFNRAEYYIKEKLYNILTVGINKLNLEFCYTNTKITLTVQNYIFKTKSFSKIVVIPSSAFTPLFIP